MESPVGLVANLDVGESGQPRAEHGHQPGAGLAARVAQSVGESTPVRLGLLRLVQANLHPRQAGRERGGERVWWRVGEAVPRLPRLAPTRLLPILFRFPNLAPHLAPLLPLHRPPPLHAGTGHRARRPAASPLRTRRPGRTARTCRHKPRLARSNPLCDHLAWPPERIVLHRRGDHVEAGLELREDGLDFGQSRRARLAQLLPPLAPSLRTGLGRQGGSFACARRSHHVPPGQVEVPVFGQVAVRAMPLADELRPASPQLLRPPLGRRQTGGGVLRCPDAAVHQAHKAGDVAEKGVAEGGRARPQSCAELERPAARLRVWRAQLLQHTHKHSHHVAVGTAGKALQRVPRRLTGPEAALLGSMVDEPSGHRRVRVLGRHPASSRPGAPRPRPVRWVGVVRAIARAK
eukprot:scaffold19930_cov115-Isochrysis_galbana.AAC.5